MLQTKREPLLPKQKDFRIFLQGELARRLQANPKYSLRAFAKFLGVAPSFLSHLLKGKRNVTLTSVKNFSQKLGIDPRQVEEFKVYHSKKASVFDEIGSAVNINQLTLDQFQIISDWYHYAILELLVVDSFEPTPKWIARALGISVAEVNIALERLERMEFIALGPKGQWINLSGNNTTIGNDFTAIAFRNLQRQILEKALVALEEIPLEAREQSSLTLAMDSHLLPEVKEAAKKFRRQLISFQERSKKKDQVYHLSVSFYPILTKEKNL